MAAILSDESRQAVRQVAVLAVQRVVQIAADFLYVALIPRAMGPQVYGQFSTVQSMAMWFTMVSGLGAVSLMTRYVPEFVQRGDLAGLRKLTGSLFTLRLGTGLLGALLYFGMVHLWLRDLDRIVVAFAALTITLRIAANLPFTLLLGLNQASRWGAAELTRRLLIFPLTYAGYHWAGLRGACAALAVVEGSVLCLGLWWSRGYLDPPSLPLDREFIKPFLQFSAVFFVGNILIMFFQQGGTPLVRLISGDYAEAGYYAIAFGGYLAGSHALWKLVSGFGPLFSSLQIKGETAELRGWIGRLLRALAVCGVVVTGFLYACADVLVSRVLGEGYEAVAALLPVLAFAGLASGPATIARILAVSYNQGRLSIIGAAVQLACFAALGGILITRMGSMGGCLAVAAAAAMFSLYSTWQIQRAIAYSMRPWAGVVVLGAVCSPLLWAWSGFGPLRFAAFLVLFTGAAVALRMIRLSEGRMLWQTVRRSA